MGIKSTSDIFFIISVSAAMMSLLSWALKPDTLWLAATQWLLIAILSGIWGVYLRIRDMHEGKAVAKNGNGNKSGKTSKKK
ncbi:MAG: hypothetical protein PHF35_03445 [Candidatus Moranbacteria bacterium]|nr:hypothetical protein [Candidatus Moranbacteria bacterium]